MSVLRYAMLTLSISSPSLAGVHYYCSGGSDAGAWSWRTRGSVGEACTAVYDRGREIGTIWDRVFRGAYQTDQMNRGTLYCANGASERVFGRGTDIFYNMSNMVRSRSDLRGCAILIN